MEEKKSFYEQFIGPAQNTDTTQRLVLGEDNIFTNEKGERIDEGVLTPDQITSEQMQRGDPKTNDVLESPDEENVPVQNKKKGRRPRPDGVVDKKLMEEVQYWHQVGQEAIQRSRAIEEENAALKAQWVEAENARREAELLRMQEREENLKIQAAAARAIGDQTYADEASSALQKLTIQKELYNYDRARNQPQYNPQYSYQNQSHNYVPPVSPLEREKHEAAQTFTQNNSWYGQNASLTEQMNTIFNELGNYYHLKGRSHEIASHDFYDEAIGYLKKAHGIDDAPALPTQQENSMSYSNVREGVPRGMPSMAENQAQSNKSFLATITPDDAKRLKTSNFSMKVKDKWVTGDAMFNEIAKNIQRVKPLTDGRNGFRIED